MDDARLVDIARVHNDLHYIRRYTAKLLFTIALHGEQSADIKFSIEHDALLRAKVKMEFLSTLQYPLLAARKKAIELIIEADKKGELK